MNNSLSRTSPKKIATIKPEKRNQAPHMNAKTAQGLMEFVAYKRGEREGYRIIEVPIMPVDIKVVGILDREGE